MKIDKITARQIIDSRGMPTIEAEVWVGDHCGRAAVPSGASTGAHEAHELRDGGAEWGGKGVQKAIENIHNEIAPALRGLPSDDQFKIDEILIALDGTDNKSRLGANAILAVSMAAAHAAASVRGIPLFQQLNDIAGQPKMSIPLPMLNVLNGGQHASNASDFQEYMIVPIGAKTYIDAIRIASECFMELKKLLQERKLPTTVGDEGGFAPPVSSNTETLEILIEACSRAGHEPGSEVAFALDVAAAEFYEEGKYKLATEKRELTGGEMISYLQDMAERYPIVSIEDGLDEDAWDDWVVLTEKLNTKQLVGDDLLVTNPERVKSAIEQKAGNSVLIKLNQIGTLSETIQTIQMAKEAGWTTVVSHRSGETEDTTISHLAVGTGAGQIKTGSVTRGERTAKHNELIRIEDCHSELKIQHRF